MKDKIIILLLTIIVIILMVIIGVFGYVIYNETSLNETVDMIGEIVHPILGYNHKNSKDTTSNIDDIVIDEPVIEQEQSAVSKNKNFYNQLGNYAKIIYDKLYENKENLKTGTYTIEFGDTFSELLKQENGSELLQKEYQSAIETLVYENPEIFYLEVTKMYINIEKITKITGVKYNVYINNGESTTYLSEGFSSKEEVDACDAQLEEVKNQILAQINGKSDYDKIKFIHDYLIDNVEYDTTLTDINIYNIYGALVSKKCVCEGYAKAFKYLLDEAGIDNLIVIGVGTNSSGQTEDHAWNYVKINNNWYAVDVTWDDPVIIGGGRLTDTLRYRYFLKGSNTMNANHESIGNFTENGQVYNYPTLSVSDYE